MGIALKVDVVLHAKGHRWSKRLPQHYFVITLNPNAVLVVHALNKVNAVVSV
jgi:hypothetical protein